jgi:fido (protein-threonine AMPylation protein)
MDLVYQAAGHIRATRPGISVIVDGRTFTRRSQVNRALAQVRHETAEKSAKPFRISSGYREVSTTFRDES